MSALHRLVLYLLADCRAVTAIEYALFASGVVIFVLALYGKGAGTSGTVLYALKLKMKAIVSGIPTAS
jgi:hypothetical protein